MNVQNVIAAQSRQSQDDLNFTWTATEFQDETLKLKMTFSNPLAVSFPIINLNFVGRSSSLSIARRAVIQRYIPKQIGSDGLSAALSSNKNGISGSVTGVSAGSFALNLVYEFTIPVGHDQCAINNPTLSTLYSHQNMAILKVYFALNFPSNALILFQVIFSFTSFNLIPADTIIQKMFAFQNDNALNDNFDNYDIFQASHYPLIQPYLTLIKLPVEIYDCKSEFNIFVYAFFGLLILLRVNRIKRLEKIFEKLKQMLFFNLILRYFFEGYIEFCINLLINIKLGDWVNYGSVISGVFSYLMLLISLWFPLFMFFKLKRNMRLIGNEIFDKKFDSLYESIDLQRNFRSINYNIVFLVRRIILAIIAVIFTEYPFSQIQTQIFSSVFVLCFLAYQNPLKEVAAFRIEIMNEACILIISYSLILFSDFMPDDPALQYEIGWFVILTTLVNIAINMGFMLVRTIYEIKALIKELQEKRRRKMKRKVEAKFKEVQDTEVNMFEKSKTLSDLKLQQTMQGILAKETSNSRKGFKHKRKTSTQDILLAHQVTVDISGDQDYELQKYSQRENAIQNFARKQSRKRKNSRQLVQQKSKKVNLERVTEITQESPSQDKSFDSQIDIEENFRKAFVEPYQPFFHLAQDVPSNQGSNYQLSMVPAFENVGTHNGRDRSMSVMIHPIISSPVRKQTLKKFSNAYWNEGTGPIALSPQQKARRKQIQKRPKHKDAWADEQEIKIDDDSIHSHNQSQSHLQVFSILSLAKPGKLQTSQRKNPCQLNQSQIFYPLMQWQRSERKL